MNNPGFIEAFIDYVSKNYMRILSATGEHIYISLIALAITLVTCIPLGIYLTRNEKLAPYVISIANVFQTIPSLALLGFLIFIFGIGNDNAICALVMYAMLPVLQNTYTGIKSVDKATVQAAKGMGMTNFQILMKVQIPLALPVIISGVRVASVWIIGTAALAAAIGGGGLGRLIFSGLSLIRDEVIFAGALPATALALLTDMVLKRFQKYTTPEERAKRIAKKMKVNFNN
jgi:osmoprotectant transport system permease protein